MKFGVVIFPGSNCDRDVIYVLEHTLNQEVVSLWHKDTDLRDCTAVILPGGFSYGDYLRSGAIARFSPIMKAVTEYATHGGFVFGICNGFQILTECGLLPGALLNNSSMKFESKSVFIRSETDDTLLTRLLPKGARISVPIAHRQGRYFASIETAEALNLNHQVVFRYCDSQGDITQAANPNGSIQNIAAICNRSRNVYGMMPHPERAASDLLGGTDGLKIFDSILAGLVLAIR